MASHIIAQVSSGEKKVLENMDTVGTVKAALNCTSGFAAMVNGSPASDNDQLEEGDFVSLAVAVKGGLK